MKPRDIFLAGLKREETPRPATGSATSIVTADLMDDVGVSFPEAHTDPEMMAALAAAGHTVLGFDNVMPLFSVWHESAALGCEVNWGDRLHMPDSRKPLCANIDEDVSVPSDLLSRPSCVVALEAISLLRERIGNDAAIVGKVFGPWTLGYHVYGVEEFLASTIDEPDRVRKVIRDLIEVTVSFAKAQIDSGADALTLADHCTRDLCSPKAYESFLFEIHQELHDRIPCPLILHICGDTSDRIPFVRETGIECFHFDAKVGAERVRELAGDNLALMGGTSNFDVVRNGDAQAAETDVREKLALGVDIIGPECAVPLDAPFRNLQALASAAKKA